MTSDSVQLRAGRTRRLAVALVSALLTRPAALVLQVVSVPLLLRYLGRERYGIFEALSSLAVWISLANAGIGLSLLNDLIDCYVAQDAARARRHIASTVVPLGAIIAAVAVLASLAAPFIRWGHVFASLSAQAERELPVAFAIAASATLADLLVSVPNAIYTAYQENHRNSLWDASGKILALGACFAVVRTGLGLVGAVLAITAVPALCRFFNMIWLLGLEKPQLRPRVRDFRMDLLRRSLRQGAAFFILQGSVMVLYQTDRVIVAARFGPAAAADYAVVSRVFALSYGLVSLVYGPLWASHGEALRRGDVSWVRRAVLITNAVGFAACAGLTLLMLGFGRSLLHAWLRTDVRAPVELVLAFAATFLVRTWVDTRSIVLNANGVLRPQIAVWGSHVALAALLVVILPGRFGPAGVAWAIPLAAVPTALWGFPWLLGRRVYGKARAADAMRLGSSAS